MNRILQSSNHRPGEPLRSWLSGEQFAPIDAGLHLKAAKAGPAVARLLNGEDVSVDDALAFGRLNWINVSFWYEPMIELFTQPRIPPPLVPFLRGLPDKDFTR